MMMARSYAVRSVLMSIIAMIMWSDAPVAGASTRYVDDDAAPGGDGLSWATAYSALETALAELPAAVPAITEVRIAQGVYHPDGGTGDRTLSYLVDGPPGVHIRGGYAGLGAPDPDAHDPATFVTLLSADLNGDDVPDGLNKTDNSHQIMRTLTPCTVSGMQFRHAYSLDDSMAAIHGGALEIVANSARIVDCVFSNNAGTSGGAIALYNLFSNVTIANCVLESNIASYSGGAIFIYGSSDQSATLRAGNVIFRGNSSSEAGGAISCLRAGLQAINCAFVGNQCSGLVGGAAYIPKVGAAHVLHNCAFVGNECELGIGGAISGTIIDEMNNCLFIDNSDGSGSGIVAQIYCEAISQARQNCVPGWNERLFAVTTNIGNLDTDPRLMDPAGQDGLYGTADDDIRLRADSPCIDAGTDRLLNDRADIDSDGISGEPPPSDLFGRPRFVDDPVAANTGSEAYWGLGPVDIGPLEYQEDCDGNLVVDSVQISANQALDEDHSGILDSCEPFIDCDGNLIRDSLDILLDPGLDCNENGVLDACEIATGVSADLDVNGVPDDCELIVIYVDDDAPMSGDGRSWATAFEDLHDAMALAAGQRIAPTIRVAAGRYRPGAATGDPRQMYRLPPGVSLEGGYAGTGADPDLRAPDLYETWIDGDINGDDESGRVGENSYRLVYCIGVGTTTTISGFRFRGSAPDPYFQSPFNRGGAVWTYLQQLDVSGCVFEENHAVSGASIAWGNEIAPLTPLENDVHIDHCVFRNNSSSDSGGALSFQGATVFVSHSRFEMNDAESGGAIYSESGGVNIEYSELIGNTAARAGGAIRFGIPTSNAWLSNCLIASNLVMEPDSDDDNAGIVVDSSSTTLVLTNCTIFGNSRYSLETNRLFVRNSIICCHSDQIWGTPPTVLTVDHSIIEYDLPHPGPSNAAIIFVDPIGPDGVPRTDDEDLRLRPGSPAIDAGNGLVADPMLLFDLDGVPRFVDDCATTDIGVLGPFPAMIDIGAYEYQPPAIIGDINGDHSVDVDDLNAILGAWNTTVGIGDPRDLANDDGFIDVDDLNIVLGNWNTVCN